MNVRVTIRGDEALTRRFANSGARTRMLAAGVTDAGDSITDAAAIISPVHTGRLATSWQVGPVRALAGVVVVSAGSPLDYAAPVSEGRGAGEKMPPPDELVAWMASRGIEASPFVIARAIARDGIPGTSILRRAMDSTRARWLSRFGMVVRHLLERS